MPKEFGYLINGKWLTGGKKREIRSPYNGETAGIVSVPDRETAIGSVGLAESAYVKWRESPSLSRAILRKCGGYRRKKNSPGPSCSKESL
jgi:acyl-CoA reductase-like NAD-dependent aldehyde dehydrogenase